MIDKSLRTAGAGGAETEACKVFGDDIVEIVRTIRATLANTDQVSALGGQPDANAVGNILFEMCLTRAVDRALTYVSNALHSVFRKYPASAQAKEKVDITFLLEFGSISELVNALVERRVHELSYRSLNDLDDHFQANLKISLFASKAQRFRAGRLVAERNLIVHNRGVVNHIFKERAPESAANVGEQVRYSPQAALEEIGFLMNWIADLDVRLIEKFGLASQPRSPRRKIEPV